MNKQLLRKPFINVLFLSIFWAFQIFTAKLAYNEGAQAITFTVQTAFFAAIFLFIQLLIFKKNELRNIFNNKYLKWILLANAIHFGIGGLSNNFGIANTSAVNAGFLVKLGMVTTILFAAYFLNERLTRAKLLAALIMLIGAYLISTQGKSIIPHWGDLFILIACVAFSIGNIMVRKLTAGTEVSGELVAFLRPIAGIPVIILFSLFSGFLPENIGRVLQLDLLNSTYFVYMVINGFFVAMLWTFLNRSLKYGTASYMTMMSSMTSIFVVILALLLLGESLNYHQILGGTFIILATGITQVKMKI
ncbi:MAG TPA: DMT family transporter [Candidatus Dojkabacteria bacterium]|nr:DMT family transporter [Candidatus Dojkabacteria bacterium]HRP51439.1 DMT family transporter [Candidatus Dojkabacteria bacterium]